LQKRKSLHNKYLIHFIPQQFNNPANPEIHRKTTAEEVWKILTVRWIFLSAVLERAERSPVWEKFLKKRKKKCSNYCCRIRKNSGALRRAAGAAQDSRELVRDLFREITILKPFDEIIKVKEEDAGATARAAAKQRRAVDWNSSGAALWAALQVSQRPENAGKLIVVLLPDTGERYLSTWLFDEPEDAVK